MKIYKLIDKDTTYTFLPIFDKDSEKIINKLISEEVISGKEKDQLIKTYDNKNILSIISDTKIIKHGIFEDDDINMVKKKIMKHLNYDYNKIHLFCKLKQPHWKLSNMIKNRILADDMKGPSNIEYSSKESNKLDIKNHLFVNINRVDYILGHKYENINGLRSFDCDILKYELEPIEIDNQDVMISNESSLLMDYNIYKDTLYCIDYDSFNEAHPDNDVYKNIFYPQLDYELLSKDYDKLIEDYDSTLIKFKKPQDFQYSLKNYKMSNLVVYCNQNNNSEIDLGYLFEKIELDKEIVFIKYKNSKRKNYYKVNNKDLVISYEGKPIEKILTNLEDYIVPYITNYYKPNITLEKLEDWKQNKLTPNERIISKNENRMNALLKKTEVDNS